jgi:PAS domain S-box-containing protein
MANYKSDNVSPGDAVSAQGLSEISLLLCQAFLDCLPQQVFYKDAQGIYRACNQKFAANFGGDVQAVIGKRDSDLYPPDLARSYQDSDRPVLEQGIAVDIEGKYLEAGEQRYVHVWKFPIRDTAGGVQGIFAIFYDTTDQRRAEHQAQSLAEYARSLIEANLDPLVTLDPEGRISDVNRAAELMIGLPREQLAGSGFSDYFTEPAKLINSYPRVLFEGAIKDYPLVLRRTSGEQVDVLYNAAVYRNATGQVKGIFAAIRDVSELRRSQKALQDAKEAMFRAAVDGVESGYGRQRGGR